VSSGAATLAVLTFFTDVADGADELPPSLLTGIAAQVGQFLERRRGELLTHALTRAKDDNFGLVGHELRTPLTSIVAYADIVLDTDEAVPFGEVRPMIEAVARNAARLRRLVDALLDLSALDSGHAPLRPAAVDLAAVVAAAVTDAMPAAAAAGIAVTANLPDRLPMAGDAMRLRQLMDILLDNAVTYDPDGGLVSIRLTRRPVSAYLEITDTGVGIPPAERDLVFDRFFRGAVAREHAIPGAGLGLAIARVIADLHHGTISLAPPVPKAGTTIAVELPLQPPPDGQPAHDRNNRSTGT
jgi:signal transduction histidine kinase